MQGFSDARAVQKELGGVDVLLERERSWFEHAPRFSDAAAITEAVVDGRLVPFTGDTNMSVVRRFRNPALNEQYPPYLTPNAEASLRGLGRIWRLVANEIGVPQEVRLAVTSLVRSQAYQNHLVAEGKLAVPDSTHVTGNAYDIDLGGYYIDLEDGREATVSLREIDPQQEIAAAFGHDLAVKRDDPVRLGPEQYTPEPTQALLYVASILHQHQFINRVVELSHTPNRVLHIAAAPGTHV